MKLAMRQAIVTGGAGFIGSHLCERLVNEGWKVTAIDDFDPFYDAAIKRRNIEALFDCPNFSLIEADIRDAERLRASLCQDYDVLVHLAARAGVRPSLSDPVGYQDVNVGGTQVLLELAKERKISQFVFASSSSVYGVNPNVPWREDDHVLLPISPYASTKVSGELLGHVYSYLYGIRFVGLRFFTVYGPRQRPDLAINKFARLILKRIPIPVYGDGSTSRDYTYIDDTVQGLYSAMSYCGSRYEIINLGNDQGITLNEMIHALEERFGVRAQIQVLPEQPGDVPITRACILKAKALLRYDPQTPFTTGIDHFARSLIADGAGVVA